MDGPEIKLINQVGEEEACGNTIKVPGKWSEVTERGTERERGQSKRERESGDRVKEKREKVEGERGVCTEIVKE